MMSFKHIYRWIIHPLVMFGTIATVLIGTLTWLTWQILQQDQALVNQRIQERLDSTADLVVAALHDKFSVLENQLASLADSTNLNPAKMFNFDERKIYNDSLITILESGKLEAYPRFSLLYYPVLPTPVEVKTDVFGPGEYDEFRSKDYASAAAAYKKLVSSADKATRTGALIRLGRALRKANDPNSALDVYRQLAESGINSIDGLPVELLARHSRCVLLEELKQVPELQEEALLLWSDLQNAKWPLMPSQYRFYEKAILHWLNSDRLSIPTSLAQPRNSLALAEAVEEVWRLWQRIQQGEVPSAGQRSIWVEDLPIYVIWRGSQDRLTALVAQPGYLEKEFITPVLQRIVEQQDVQLALADADGRPVLGEWVSGKVQQAIRTPVQTQLPWTLQLASIDPSIFMTEMKVRSRLFWGGLVTMVALVLAAGYAIVRSVSRELKVARLQGDFVSAVSHEFRTPLASLCHLSELLADGRVPTDKRRQDYYQALRRESERLHRLVESILDFRRMEVGAHEHQLEKLDPAALVRTVADEFAREVRDLDFSVEIRVENTLPSIKADREALSRAIWNLLDNAVKYSPSYKKIEIQANCDSNRVAIHVRDHGLGISRSEQEKIFEKFFRASGAKAAGVRGTGLGLTMVQHIVSAHGGYLNVESQPGVGSTFTIFLPFERD